MKNHRIVFVKHIEKERKRRWRRREKEGGREHVTKIRKLINDTQETYI